MISLLQQQAWEQTTKAPEQISQYLHDPRVFNPASTAAAPGNLGTQPPVTQNALIPGTKKSSMAVKSLHRLSTSRQIYFPSCLRPQRKGG